MFALVTTAVKTTWVNKTSSDQPRAHSSLSVLNYTNKEESSAGKILSAFTHDPHANWTKKHHEAIDKLSSHNHNIKENSMTHALYCIA